MAKKDIPESEANLENQTGAEGLNSPVHPDSKQLSPLEASKGARERVGDLIANKSSQISSGVRGLADRAGASVDGSVNRVTQGDGNISKATRATQGAIQLARGVSNSAKNIGAALGGLITALGNPMTWIIATAIALFIFLILSVMTGLQVYGKNDSIENCGKDGSVSQIDFPENGSTDEKIAAMMSWFMSNNFEDNDSKPMSREQAAAVAGNFAAESGVSLKTTERNTMDGASNDQVEAWTLSFGGAANCSGFCGGLGLAQWTHNPGRAGGLIDLARSMKLNWYDAEVQLSMIQKELNEGSYGDKLKRAGFFDTGKNAGELAIIFHDIYEGSSDTPEKKQRRADLAKQAVADFKGGGYSSAGGDNCQAGASGDWVYPLEPKNGGPLNWTTYSSSSEHRNGALDINNIGGGGVETDWPVYAIGDGTILTVGDGACQPFEIEHPEAGVTSVYMHMNSIEPGMKPGAVVKAGQKIGGVGTVGCGSTGNHLHFSIHPGGKRGIPTPAHKWMAEKGVDMGKCVEGPCELGEG